MNKKHSLSFLLAILLSSLSGYGQQNMELVGRLPYPIDPGVNPSVFLNDIWGYVDSTGREYALVGTLAGLSIVDLQDPSQPEEIHFVRGDTSLWRDIKTYQHYAYTVNETGGGLTIVDLSGLPESVQVKDTIFVVDSLFNEELIIENDTLENGQVVMDTTTVIDTLLFRIRRAHNLYQDEGTLFMVGMNQFRGGMAMLDLTEDPWNPSIKGSYSERYVHDVYVRNDTAYTAEINNRQLAVIDISNPETPTVLGTRSYPGAFTHNTWLNDAGTVCFTTDERSAAFVIAWDVTDPENIEELDRIRSSLSQGTATPHNVHVQNDFLITSYYADGIHIVDAQRPHNLIEVGYYDTHPASSGGFSGSWGAYPFLPSGLVLASDRSEGLFVLQPSYTRGSYLEGKVVDAISGEVLDNTRLYSFGVETFEEVSKNDGSFAMGTIQEGEVQLVVERFGYLTDTFQINLVNGQLIDTTLALRSAITKTLVFQVEDENTGLALASSPISLFNADFDVRTEAQTDEQGIYVGTLPLERFEILVGNWGYRTQKIVLDLREETGDTLVVPLEFGYYDDFGLDFGWQAGGIPEKGIWERVFPSPTFLGSEMLNPDRDAPTDLDSLAYVTDNSGISFQDADVDSVLTRLQSPIMDLSRYEDPVIFYSYWLAALQADFSFSPSTDSLEVFLHTPRDSILITKLGGPFSDGWKRVSFRPKDFLEMGDSMWVSFSIIDSDPGDFIEVGIDHFEVLESDLVSTSQNLPTSFTVYPNPVETELFISGSTKAEVSWKLFNVGGQLLSQGVLPRGSQHHSLPFPFGRGIYFLYLDNGEFPVFWKKLVK